MLIIFFKKKKNLSSEIFHACYQLKYDILSHFFLGDKQNSFIHSHLYYARKGVWGERSLFFAYSEFTKKAAYYKLKLSRWLVLTEG